MADHPRVIPELDVTSLDLSLDFYTGVVGFDVLYQRPAERFAMIDLEGARLMLEEADGPGRRFRTARRSGRIRSGRSGNRALAPRSRLSVNSASTMSTFDSPRRITASQSARDPDEPVSVVGLEAPDFVVDSFEVSYGDPQPVRDGGSLLVEHVPATGRYRLGVRVLRLANAVLGRLNLRDVAMNTQAVASGELQVGPLEDEDWVRVRALLERHREETGSPVAAWISRPID